MLSSAVISVVANTQYFYQVSDSNGICTGPIYSFVSAPGAEALGNPTPAWETLRTLLCKRKHYKHSGVLANRWEAA